MAAAARRADHHDLAHRDHGLPIARLSGRPVVGDDPFAVRLAGHPDHRALDRQRGARLRGDGAGQHPAAIHVPGLTDETVGDRGDRTRRRLCRYAGGEFRLRDDCRAAQVARGVDLLHVVSVGGVERRQGQIARAEQRQVGRVTQPARRVVGQLVEVTVAAAVIPSAQWLVGEDNAGAAPIAADVAKGQGSAPARQAAGRAAGTQGVLVPVECREHKVRWIGTASRHAEHLRQPDRHRPGVDECSLAFSDRHQTPRLLRVRVTIVNRTQPTHRGHPGNGTTWPALSSLAGI